MPGERRGIREHPLDHLAPGDATGQSDAAPARVAIYRKAVGGDDLRGLHRALQLRIPPCQRDMLNVRRDEQAGAFRLAASYRQHVPCGLVRVDIAESQAEDARAAPFRSCIVWRGDIPVRRLHRHVGTPQGKMRVALCDRN